MATLERVREIGTLRAIGAQRRFILAMLVIEAIVVGFVFGGLGAGLGAVLVSIIGKIGIPAKSDVWFFFFSGPRLHPFIGTSNVDRRVHHRAARERLLQLLPRLAGDAGQPAPGDAGGRIAMSKLGVDLTIAFRSLVQHRRRSLFLGVAIAAVTALLVLLNGLSTGVRETMIDTATTLSTGHVNVGGFFKVTAGQAAPVVTDYKKVLGGRQEGRPRDGVRGPPRARLGQDRLRHRVDAARRHRHRHHQRAQVRLRCCSWSSGKLDDLAQPGTILIFDNQAEKLGVKVGDALTISAPTTRGTNNTIDVRIVAIAHSLGLLSTWNCFVPIDSLRALYQLNQDSTGVIQIMLDRKDLDHIPAIAGRLRQALETGGLPGDGRRPARVLDEVPVGRARGLDRAEAGRHQLGRRDLVHDLDAEGAAGAVRSC